MTYQKAIHLACERLGSQAGLAKAIDVVPAIVHQWRSGVRPVPVQHCLAIERATAGAVSRRDLRPDDWHLIWPELDTPEPPETAEAVSA
jgi:DNA-binding transcriptional regulator YdaS (Cro superfamily)